MLVSTKNIGRENLILILFLLPITGPQLKVVSTMSVGFDHVSLPESAKR